MQNHKTNNVQFLNVLQEIMGYEKKKDFAEACGQAVPNMSNYLSGQLPPGKRVLKSCLHNLFEWRVKPLKEVDKLSLCDPLPDKAGVYIIYDSSGSVLYIGKAKNFASEIEQTLKRKVPVGMRLGHKMRKIRPTMRDMASHLSMYEISSDRLRHNVEALLLRVFVNQTHNRNIGKFR